MKIESTTLKCILYTLIAIFFIILIGQYIKVPDIEGLENQDEDEATNIQEISTQSELSAGYLRDIKLDDDDRTTSTLFTPSSEYTGILQLSGMPFSPSRIQDTSGSYLTNMTLNNTNLIKNINSMKEAASLDSQAGRIKATQTIDNFIENTRLFGINMMLNNNGMNNKFIQNAYPTFVKDYKQNMDFMQDLRAYVANQGSGSGLGMFSGMFSNSAKSTLTQIPPIS
jgi:hypothetical protein